ncbi:hypothetical protein CP976_42025 [Streptomyces coeruleorubidus]|uniref:Uncharacterized protein n=1 Tax=Streptomyces coeruleorubidus TaxID=116188 RepID=A0A5J6IFM1_STRC4|nr:hypothetical protein CP976_42025 [Streptomyces coeruleorubidus]
MAAHQVALRPSAIGCSPRPREWSQPDHIGRRGHALLPAPAGMVTPQRRSTNFEPAGRWGWCE